GSATLNNGGIVLVNTDDSIVNRSNSSYNNGGIFLLYSDGDNLTGNSLIGDVEGIRFEGTNDTIISGNVVSSSTDTGILTAGSSQTNYYPFPYSNLYSTAYPFYLSAYSDSVMSNTVKSSQNDGIALMQTSGCNITYNYVAGNGADGIYAYDFLPSIFEVFNDTTDEYDLLAANFTYISNNTILNNNLDGLDFVSDDGSYCGNSWDCTDSTISNNLASGNLNGIYQATATSDNYTDNTVKSNGNEISYSDSNNLSYDNGSNNSNDGFLFNQDATRNVLDHDQGINNSNNGFETVYGGWYNLISYSNATNNTNNGIWLWETDYTNISNNNASDNHLGMGLYGSSYTVINNNQVYGGTSQSGVYLTSQSDDNLLANNTVSNDTGILNYGFDIESDFNTLANNTVNNTVNGFLFVGSYNNVTSNSISTFPISPSYGYNPGSDFGYHLGPGDYNIFANNTAYGYQNGFTLIDYTSPTSFNNFTGNNVSWAGAGYVISYLGSLLVDNYFSNNTASNVGTGFEDGFNNSFLYNNVSNASIGFLLGTNDTLSGNIITNTTYGMDTYWGGGV